VPQGARAVIAYCPICADQAVLKGDGACSWCDSPVIERTPNERRAGLAPVYNGNHDRRARA
jgi:hypothetical protein